MSLTSQLCPLPVRVIANCPLLRLFPCLVCMVWTMVTTKVRLPERKVRIEFDHRPRAGAPRTLLLLGALAGHAGRAVGPGQGRAQFTGGQPAHAGHVGGGALPVGVGVVGGPKCLGDAGRLGQVGLAERKPLVDVGRRPARGRGAGGAGAVEGGGAPGDVARAPVGGEMGVGAADACPCPSAERTPGMSRYAPIPPSTTTMPRKAGARWAGLRSMALATSSGAPGAARRDRADRNPHPVRLAAAGLPPPIRPGPAGGGGAADWPPPAAPAAGAAARAAA